MKFPIRVTDENGFEAPVPLVFGVVGHRADRGISVLPPGLWFNLKVSKYPLGVHRICDRRKLVSLRRIIISGAGTIVNNIKDN